MGIRGARRGGKVNWSVGRCSRDSSAHTFLAGSRFCCGRGANYCTPARGRHGFVLFGGGASCSAYGIAVTTVKVSLTSFRLTSKLTPRLKSER